MNTDYEREYNRIMNLLVAAKMDHGTCLPVERRACTACAAKRDIEKLVLEYPGPRITRSQSV